MEGGGGGGGGQAGRYIIGQKLSLVVSAKWDNGENCVVDSSLWFRHIEFLVIYQTREGVFHQISKH